MKRPDINRVRRAAEHLKAAMTNLDSIKWENRTNKENEQLEWACGEIRYIKNSLESVAKVAEEEQQ